MKKRVKRLIRELNIYAITIKTHRPHSNKKIVEKLENVLKQDFRDESINEKMVWRYYLHPYIK